MGNDKAKKHRGNVPSGSEKAPWKRLSFGQDEKWDKDTEEEHYEHKDEYAWKRYWKIIKFHGLEKHDVCVLLKHVPWHIC